MMNENDKLEQLTDAELSEVFAVEVGGWTKEPRGRPWNEVMCLIDEKGKINNPQYATDANAVLPWLEKHANENGSVEMRFRFGFWRASLYEMENFLPECSMEETTFPRAACIALIHAKRAEQQTTGESK